MLLSVDIGNTNITLGIFNDEILLKTFRLVSNKNLSEDEYKILLLNTIEEYKINACIISSVTEELNNVIKNACDKAFGINSTLLKNDAQNLIKIALKKPNETGSDRIANACAAKMLYKLPAIVVDIGTATTFDIVNKKGEFIGGVIMPGINTQLSSLNLSTSKLPKVKVDISETAIGNDTQNAILSGVIRGSACAIEGLIKQCESELGEKATIIATGGYCTLIAKYMNKKFDYINPDLTLHGLRYLYKACSNM